MRLKFTLDEESRKTVCHFKLSRKYTGPPGYAHGGIIATILDEAMGKVNKFRNVLALTGSTSTALAGTSGKFALISIQSLPEFVVL